MKTSKAWLVAAYLATAGLAPGQVNDIVSVDCNRAIRPEAGEAGEAGEAVDFYNRGISWLEKKEYDRAIADFGEAIRLDPKYAAAYYNRAVLRSTKKDYDRAIADFGEVIRLDPKLALAYHGRGNAWLNKKEYDRAIADFGEAVRVDPKYPKAYNNRAWVWATCPIDRIRDGKKAVESATRACELTEWKNAGYLETLAAGYAESGEFDKAVEWQEKARPLNSNEGTKIWKKTLDLYRAKKPYRGDE